MVEVLVIPDGAAEPIRPGVPTTLERTSMPTLDALAAEGTVARVATTPPGLPAGSETGIPALLGRAPARPVGRGRVDAAAYGVAVAPGLVPWRADVLTADGRRAPAPGAACLAARLEAGGIRAVPTRGHRLVLLAASRPAGGATADGLRLEVWPDGPVPAGPPAAGTVVVCGPGAAAGCARLLGAAARVPVGATGDLDTDLDAKARAAAAAIAEGARRVVVHVGGPDEASHRGEEPAKVAALEWLDALILAPLREAVAAAAGTLAVCPDHGTDPRDGRHSAAAVPAVRWGAHVSPAGPARCTERAVAATAVRAAAWPLAGDRRAAPPASRRSAPPRSGLRPRAEPAGRPAAVPASRTLAASAGSTREAAA